MGGTRRRRARSARSLVPWALGVALAVASVSLAGLERNVAESGFRRIQANRVSLDPGKTWVDPRWEGELAVRLAVLGTVDASDVGAREALLAEILSLSFVAELGEPRVLWPDGLSVPVRFQNPVACVAATTGYLAVAPDGTVLSGERDAPPQIGTGWLPVIGSHGTEPRLFVPGDVIADEALLDALDVAVSMWVYLSPPDLATLGRVRIDADSARLTGPDEPGTRIHLEGGRTIGFGRAPRMGEPGSLPAAAKWAQVSRALELVRTGFERADWRWIDVRWDRAEMELFAEEE